MTDWLVVLPRDNWEICAREGLLGGTDRLERMADGDRIWVYVNKERTDSQLAPIRRIRASAIVRGPVRHLTHVPWNRRRAQSFPFARGITIERQFDIPGPELIKTLSFVVDPTNWGAYLRTTPIRLTVADVGKLEEAVGRSRSV